MSRPGAFRQITGIESESAVENVISRINYIRRTKKTASQWVILVEGSEDKTLYRRFTQKGQSAIVVTAGTNVMEPLIRRLPDTERFVAIEDADFNNIVQYKTSNHNKCYTDAHDTEMMCLSQGNSRNVFLLKVNCSGEIFQSVFDELKLYSILKLINVIEDRGYSFNDVNEEICESPTADITNPNFLLSRVPNQGSRFIVAPYLNGKRRIYDLVDLYQLTNGHDFLIRLAKRLGHTENSIRRELYAGFSLNDFHSTRLYHDLQAWEQEHHVTLFS